MWRAQRRGQSPWPGTDQRSEKTRIVNIVSQRQRGHERDELTICSAHFSHVFWCPAKSSGEVANLLASVGSQRCANMCPERL